VQSSTLHGSKTWPAIKENEVALQRTEMRMIIEQELGAIYLLEMTKCLTSIFGKGLPWDIQNRTS